VSQSVPDCLMQRSLIRYFDEGYPTSLLERPVEWCCLKSALTPLTFGVLATEAN
jgi:hypothetical protein